MFIEEPPHRPQRELLKRSLPPTLLGFGVLAGVSGAAALSGVALPLLIAGGAAAGAVAWKAYRRVPPR